MKTISIVAAMVFVPLLLAAQPMPEANPQNSRWEAEFALDRIEHGLQLGTPKTFEDLLPFAITMRLEDTLYSSISRIKAYNLLKKYFSGKDSVQFTWLGRPGTGKLSYVSGGKRNSVYVDVWLGSTKWGYELRALNMSNYPFATALLNVHPKKRP